MTENSKVEITIEVRGGVVDSINSTGPAIVKVIDHDNCNEKGETEATFYYFGTKEELEQHANKLHHH